MKTPNDRNSNHKGAPGKSNQAPSNPKSGHSAGGNSGKPGETPRKDSPGNSPGGIQPAKGNPQTVASPATGQPPKLPAANQDSGRKSM